MGVGEFLSSKANNEWILNEKKREEWELENYREGEIQEMIDIYVQGGVPGGCETHHRDHGEVRRFLRGRHDAAGTGVASSGGESRARKHEGRSVTFVLSPLRAMLPIFFGWNFLTRPAERSKLTRLLDRRFSISMQVLSCSAPSLPSAQCHSWDTSSFRSVFQTSGQPSCSKLHVSSLVWSCSCSAPSRATFRKFALLWLPQQQQQQQQQQHMSRAHCVHASRFVLNLLSLLVWSSMHSRSNWFWSGLETLLLGGACATLAFTIGYYVNELLGEDGEDVA
jgi:hypothetical protein